MNLIVEESNRLFNPITQSSLVTRSTLFTMLIINKACTPPSVATESFEVGQNAKLQIACVIEFDRVLAIDRNAAPKKQ